MKMLLTLLKVLLRWVSNILDTFHSENCLPRYTFLIFPVFHTGVVPGGGATMLHMSCDEELKKSIMDGVDQNDEDEKLGVEIMFRSLPAPIR